MSLTERLDLLIKQRNGLILTRDVEEAGIPRAYLSSRVQRGELERVSPGVYLSVSALDDEPYRIQVRHPLAIFSHETALWLHDLTDRDPLTYMVTVPSSYNSLRLKQDNVRIFYVKKELHTRGVTNAKTSQGRDIKVYDLERTICDIVRSRNQMDIALMTETLKRYAKRKDKNVTTLMVCAEAFGVEGLVRRYLEVLL